jgi:hypothetical protein
VKAYEAASDFVFVTRDRKVDFPTDGNPTSAIRASPDLETSNPVPAVLLAPGAGSSSWARRRASFLVSVSYVKSSMVAILNTLSKDQDDTL